MKANRKKRLLIILFVLLGLGSGVGAMTYALRQNLNSFYSIDDIYSGEAPLERQIRIGGLVKPNSIQRDKDSLNVSFVIEKGGKEVTVLYEGILPDLFREGQGIITKGELTGKDKFVAKEVLTKHDENYMPKELKDEMDERHPGGYANYPDATSYESSTQQSN